MPSLDETNLGVGDCWEYTEFPDLTKEIMWFVNLLLSM